jgi:hypothetical protein
MRLPPLLVPRSARWSSIDGRGLTHVSLKPDDDGIVIDGVAIGDREATRYGAYFRIVCDTNWATRRLAVDTTDGHRIRVASGGDGRWVDGKGTALPEFDGCIDVDLEGTPITNTLPIRRLNLEPGSAAVELRMLYVPFDTFRPLVDEQRYRCVSHLHYRYEAVDGSFDAGITVDEDGLVVDYPPLFSRLDLAD